MTRRTDARGAARARDGGHGRETRDASASARLRARDEQRRRRRRRTREKTREKSENKAKEVLIQSDDRRVRLAIRVHGGKP